MSNFARIFKLFFFNKSLCRVFKIERSFFRIFRKISKKLRIDPAPLHMGARFRAKKSRKRVLAATRETREKREAEREREREREARDESCARQQRRCAERKRADNSNLQIATRGRRSKRERERERGRETDRQRRSALVLHSRARLLVQLLIQKRLPVVG